MRRLPPPTIASLPSAFFSFLLHGGVVIATLVSMPEAAPLPATTQHYVPIELVDLSTETNLTEVAAAMEKADEEAALEEESKAAPAPAPPPVEEDSVSLDEPKEQPKPDPKKDNKAAPAPSKSLSSELDDILAGIEKTPKPSKTRGDVAPASASNEAPRLSVGDRRRMTATITDILVSQLKDNRCWADHSDMADAKRLRATFRIAFGRNGKFSIRPELISPVRKPANDPPLNTFIVHAERALNMCNQIGWRVPEDYFRLPEPRTIDLEFLPKIGAEQ
jgi:outer membrane biosynthesis protein TonB